MIIGVGGEKGGCGKTTLATNIAAVLVPDHTVCLIDADPKPAASRWIERRVNTGDMPQIHSKRAIGDIDDTIKACGKKYDFTIIDCGGLDSKEMRFAIAYGDIFIAPFMPSIYDTDTATAIDKICASGQIFNPDIKCYSVLMNASNHPKSRSNRETRADLETMKNLVCMQACTHNLDEYRFTARAGLGAVEGKNENAKSEMLEIVKELCLI